MLQPVYDNDLTPRISGRQGWPRPLAGRRERAGSLDRGRRRRLLRPPTAPPPKPGSAISTWCPPSSSGSRRRSAASCGRAIRPPAIDLRLHRLQYAAPRSAMTPAGRRPSWACTGSATWPLQCTLDVQSDPGRWSSSWSRAAGGSSAAGHGHRHGHLGDQRPGNGRASIPTASHRPARPGQAPRACSPTSTTNCGCGSTAGSCRSTRPTTYAVRCDGHRGPHAAGGRSEPGGHRRRGTRP